MELEIHRCPSGSGGLIMAAIAHVLTLARVAQLLGEDEDLLHEISIKMEPEDGVIGVHGVGDDYMSGCETSLARATTLRAGGNASESGGLKRRLTSFGSATRRLRTTSSGHRPLSTRWRLRL